MEQKQTINFSSQSKNKKILTIINYTLCILFSSVLVGFIIAILILGDPTNRLGACISNLIYYLLPFVIQWAFKTKLSPALLLVYIIFVTLSGFCGSCLLVNKLFPPFDKIQHFSWGYISCIIALYILCKTKEIKTLNPITIILFFTGLSLATASVWEIFEFLGDTFFGQTAQGKPINGFTPVTNTMFDIISHTLGTLVFLLHYTLDRFTHKNLGITSLINDFNADN